MRGLFGFSIVEFFRKWKRSQWISLGLKSEQIQLSNGTSLHCWVLQKNDPHSSENRRPSLLLVHGFGADSLTGWDTQICALDKRFDLFIPDLIFFGDSTTKSSERTEIFQAECLKSMLQHFGVESVIVVGHSYGGFVGFWMAHKYPNLVRRLVIVSSGICMSPSTNDPLLEEFGSSDIEDLLIPKNVRGLKKVANFSFYRMPWLPSFIYKDFLQAFSNCFREMLTFNGLNLNISKTVERNKDQKAELLHATVIGSKSLQALPSLNQDVLIVWGHKDRIFRLEEAYVLQRHIGEKGKLVVIKECGHVVPLEKPSELNKQILEFVQLEN